MMIVFAVACMAVYIVNSTAAIDAKPKYADAAGIAAMLCVSFGVTNALVAVYGMPEAALFFPVFDAVFAFMVWRAWQRTRKVWKLIVAGLLVGQLAMHVAMIASWNNGLLTHSGLVSYVFMLNADFTLQLLAVGSAGVSYWVSRAVDWLSRVRREPVEAYARK